MLQFCSGGGFSCAPFNIMPMLRQDYFKAQTKGGNEQTNHAHDTKKHETAGVLVFFRVARVVRVALTFV